MRHSLHLRPTMGLLALLGLAAVLPPTEARGELMLIHGIPIPAPLGVGGSIFGAVANPKGPGPKPPIEPRPIDFDFGELLLQRDFQIAPGDRVVIYDVPAFQSILSVIKPSTFDFSTQDVGPIPPPLTGDPEDPIHIPAFLDSASLPNLVLTYNAGALSSLGPLDLGHFEVTLGVDPTAPLVLPKTLVFAAEAYDEGTFQSFGTLALEVQSVPEPSTWPFAALGFTSMLCMLWRSRATR